MNGRTLFFRRLFDYYRYQFKVFHAVIDWTVALYIVLPALAFVIYQYIDLMNGRGLFYKWSEMMEWRWLYAVCVLIVCTGSIHTFLMEADKVFLLQKKEIIYQLKQYALMYSFLVTLAKWLLLFFIVLPFISHITLAESTALLCYLFGLHTTFLALKQDRIRKPRSISRRIAEILFRAVLFSGSAVLIVFTEWRLLALIGILFLIFAFVRGWKKTALFSAFEAEVTEEKKSRLALAGLVMMMSQEAGIPKVKDRLRRKPLLYRNSKRIFKRRTILTGYKELFFKVTLRNGEYARQMYMLLSAFTVLIFVSPIWLKLIALLVYTGVCRYILTLIFDKVMDAPFLIGADKESDEYYRARKSCINTLHYAFAAFCFVAAAVSLLFT
ncbi:ABC transporter permease [Bacillus spizizenii]|uniref:Membrane protein, putative n=1 Tax=Bacillus spizizenii (strain DSM 15029 / JCM 12233 / NBRC 101239 / NRRL B-23049 / TU-B-10) TaxID=1052585 RepID=G4NZM1_BACS4|nr:ABC transporter permease [Bacillus spizizenii]AEP87850.1 membrane protein, putative [Bacillus spizizenii TU-B-10]MEC1433753.1 ABC transporter permease [Bacillus spizizenii]GEK26409.1 putative transporter YthQ [Bacillus spizizenii]